MGLTAFGMLLIKRQYEHPRRELLVWWYDISKQLIGSLGIHFVNLGISILKDHETMWSTILKLTLNDDDDNDQCDWYFVNLLMDTTLGIPILWAVLHILERLLTRLGVSNIKSGNYYGEVPQKERISGNDEMECLIPRKQTPQFSSFVKQTGIFILGLLVMKTCVYLIADRFEGLTYWFANLILGWADHWPNLQISLLMFVFPILLNCFQYFCIDNLIKSHTTITYPQPTREVYT